MRCFGPLEPVYDWDAVGVRCQPRAIEAGPRSLWRYAALLPVAPPADAASGPGWTPLVPAPRLAQRARRRRGAPQARPLRTRRTRSRTASWPLPRRRRSSSAPTRWRARRPATSGTRSPRAPPPTRHARRRPLPARPSSRRSCSRRRSTAARCTACRGSYDDCSRLVVELAGELDWGFVNVNLRAYYAEGSKTLAFEIAEQLGWETARRGRRAGRLGLAVHEALAGVRAVRAARPRRRARSPRIYGGQAEGCAPVAPAFAEERRVSPVRPADDRALARDRGPRRRRPRDRDRAARRAARSTRCRGRRRPEHVAARGDGRGLRRDGGRRHVGALRAASARRARRDDRVVVLVTGTGLKTPQRSSRADRRDRADVDALLEELGVTA